MEHFDFDKFSSFFIVAVIYPVILQVLKIFWYFESKLFLWKRKCANVQGQEMNCKKRTFNGLKLGDSGIWANHKWLLIHICVQCIVHTTKEGSYAHWRKRKKSKKVRRNLILHFWQIFDIDEDRRCQTLAKVPVNQPIYCNPLPSKALK